MPGGTTQNSFDVHAVKYGWSETLEISAELQHEWWKAPVYQPGERNDTVATFQLTLYPQWKKLRAVSGLYDGSKYCPRRWGDAMRALVLRRGARTKVGTAKS